MKAAARVLDHLFGIPGYLHYGHFDRTLLAMLEKEPTPEMKKTGGPFGKVMRAEGRKNIILGAGSFRLQGQLFFSGLHIRIAQTAQPHLHVITLLLTFASRHTARCLSMRAEAGLLGGKQQHES